MKDGPRADCKPSTPGANPGGASNSGARGSALRADFPPAPRLGSLHSSCPSPLASLRSLRWHLREGCPPSCPPEPRSDPHLREIVTLLFERAFDGHVACTLIYTRISDSTLSCL